MARQPRRARNAAARSSRRAATIQAFDALTVEGALIAPAQLALIAEAKAAEQEDAEYGVPKGLTLRDEIPRYFRIAQALWRELGSGESTSHEATVRFAQSLLRDVFGFSDLARVPHKEHEGRVHPVTLEALGGRVPVVVARPAEPLDRHSEALSTSAGRRTSAALALQDWLNAQEGALWGLACNGERLRLVRDNPSLTRPAYVEADLRRMFEDDAFADFHALWLLVHASRFGRQDAPSADCALERWRDAGQKAGVAARDRLRDGVEAALQALGTGFLSHPANGELRQCIESNSFDLMHFHGLLLRLVYRLIFLLAAEDRNLLHDPKAAPAARRLYAEGYSLARLRTRSARRSAWDAHDDLWDGLQVTFAALSRGEPTLGLPALAGLFRHGELELLESCALPNRALMAAIYRLAWLKDGNVVAQVNWRDMETEELGSVYESLLELTPRLSEGGRTYSFAEGGETRGNQRKTTGSYYTPDSLVQRLLDSALDPVLDRAERESENPIDALLKVTVVDPACGSGHFLLAAARRIATRVARLRAGGAASAEDYRHALRDVARSCIHGVDRNPMAVELTKVALWIETVEPGKPLGFLDANIRCGDALFGIFDLSVLEKGIPDAAYKPLAGDDPAAARAAGKVNRDQKALRQKDLVAGLAAQDLARQVEAVIAMPEDDVASLRRKADAWARLHSGRAWASQKLACDAYLAAFLREKKFRDGGLEQVKNLDRVPTTLDVWTALSGQQPDPSLTAIVVELAQSAAAFHWPLEFPGVFDQGGFDVVLGNPPWDVSQFDEKEFFASRAPDISSLEGRRRKDAIEYLQTSNPTLWRSYREAMRAQEVATVVARASGRFTHTASGKLNLYSLFAELASNLSSRRGRVGMVLQSGIVTDQVNGGFFRNLIVSGRLVSVYDMINLEGIFPGIHRTHPHFCLFTMAGGDTGQDAEASFHNTNTRHLDDERRVFRLRKSDLELFNPNTGTCPTFMSRMDAELTRKIYERHPILMREGLAPENPWDVTIVQNFFSHTTDGESFLLEREASEGASIDTSRWVPLYEGKMVDAYDHRYGSFAGRGDERGNRVLPPTLAAQYEDASYEPTPHFWVSRERAFTRARDKSLPADWLIVWKDITTSITERTTKVAVIPFAATDDTLSILSVGTGWLSKSALLIANMNSIVFDYVARQKVSGLHLRRNVMIQLPIIPPQDYRPKDIEEISRAVVELSYTSNSLAPFAQKAGYIGLPFKFDHGRREVLRARLDAWYARAYGLSRADLQYILDPADVMGSDYPSETFRVLKEKEIRLYGEYRTRRLVLEAWDALYEGTESSSRTLADA